LRFLVITVGGSCAPVVTSVKQNTPDKIYFLCSTDTETTKGSYRVVEGRGMVCGDDRANILTQTEIPENSEQYEIIKIDDFDNFNSCYKRSLETLRNIRDRFPDAEIIADYTGGTKSMSAGLAAATTHVPGVTLSIVKGERTDLVKVLNDTQYVSLTNENVGFLQNQLELMDSLSRRYDYDGVLSVLDRITKLKNISSEADRLIRKRLALSKGFLAWDCFNHAEAWRLLSPYRGQMVDNIKFLEAVIWSRKGIDSKFREKPIPGLSNKPKGHGYELVEELLLNSERRASQGRYDDAVGRLYRALELLVQIRLKLEYGIETGNVDIEKIPAGCRDVFKSKKNAGDEGIKTGLRESYELLTCLNKDDVLTKIYSDRKDKLNDILKIRNSSLFAHGFQPIPKEEYNKFHTFIEGLLTEFFSGINAKKYTKRCQFPSKLQ